MTLPMRLALYLVVAVGATVPVYITQWPQGCGLTENCGIDKVNGIFWLGLTLLVVAGVILGVEHFVSRRRARNELATRQGGGILF